MGLRLFGDRGVPAVQDALARVDHDHFHTGNVDLWVLTDQNVIDQITNFRGDFDAGRARADDHEAQHLRDQALIGFTGRCLETIDDVVAQRHRV